MPKIITRSDTKYGGTPAELPSVSPSTYRDIIRYFYYLININSGKLSLPNACNAISRDVKKIWLKINPNLPLITDQRIYQKLKSLIEDVKKLNWNHLKSKKQSLDDKLDKIFYICTCTCGIPALPCSNKWVKCKDNICETEHLVCTCGALAYLPAEDKEYLKDLLLPNTTKKYQLGPVDKNFKPKRDQKMGSPDGIDDESAMFSTGESTDEHSEQDDWQPTGRVDYGRVKYPHAALESIRYAMSSNAIAAAVNGTILDLKAYFRDEVNIEDLFVDKSKMDRAKQSLKKQADSPEDTDRQLECLGIDAKTDDATLTYTEVEQEGETILRRVKKREHHLIFTVESGDNMGKYLCHRNLPLKGATGEVLARETLSVLEESSSIGSLLAVLMDNTNVNTGRHAGLHAILETLLCRPLHLIGCALHFNELPLKSIFRKIDGSSTGPNAFSGPIGERCSEDIWLQPLQEFKTISIDLSHAALPEDLDISNDQRLMYEYATAISGRPVDPRWLHRQIGPVNHARWITLAIRLMSTYMRTAKPDEALKSLTTYVVKVYVPAWFEFKTKPFLSECPQILQRMITRLKQVGNSLIQETVKESIQRNAYFLLPENFIYCLICSDSVRLRKMGWRYVLRSRSSNPTSTRRTIPSINFNARDWSQLISIDGIFREPPCTMSISTEQVSAFMEGARSCVLPKFPNNSQGVERAVKLISKASQHVFGLEARHQMVKAQMLAHQARPEFMSKGHYVNNYSSM